MRGSLGRILALAAILTLANTAVAPAQVFTGRIEVTVNDSTGGVLPGVSVELTGPRNMTLVTGADGAARFLNLEPGTYQVKATLAGFKDYLNKSVPVAAGANVPLKVEMGMAGVAEQVEVLGETPVIDTKKSGTSTAVTLQELQNIPSARDPWVVMQTVPGIIVDRVNVGGSESGQQSGYQAKGASGADATWNMDGIPITDMAATGATPTYYDFDMFQEMNVTTGGADMTSATGGVQLSFILKSGSNTPHGSARFYYEDEGMQSNNMDAALATALGSPNGKGNRTDMYKDYGFEIGGPIFKDRLWGWGSLGKTDVYILTIRQTPDNTFLKNRALKLQGQATQNLRAGFTYFYGNKEKFGRSASATRPPETTVNQAGPSSFYKGEVNYVVGNNLFLTGRFSHFPTGFSFIPQGGMDKQVYQDDDGVWHGSYWDYVSDRPQQTAVAEGSYFKGRHEVKFGYSWRRVTVDSTSTLSGNEIVTYHNGYPDLLASAVSDWASAARAYYQSAWVGDTMTANRLTLNFGVRFDRQTDGTLETSESGIDLPIIRNYLPAISADPIPNAIKWNSLSPRVSASFALDENSKTLVRGSYAKFASQLGNGTSSQIAVVQYRYVMFGAVDLNGNNLADPNEINYNDIQAWSGFDIDNPNGLETINEIGDYHVPTTHEVIVGLDRELFANFGVSGAFTWRRLNNFNWYPRIGLSRANYKQAGVFTATGLPDGSSASTPYYALDTTTLSEAALNAAQGTSWTGQDGYHQQFIGFELQATKRLSNRWMARVAFSSNQHTEHFDDPNTSIIDPTPDADDPYVDGGLVITASSGSGKSGIYQLLPKYQMTANGLYQAPFGIDLGVNYVMRQGFGQPWHRTRVATGDYFSNNKTVALFTDINENRLPTINTLDLRVGKLFNISRVRLNLDFDVFNVFNSGTVLGRQYDYRLTGATGFDQVLEIMNPRILRVGARIGF